jgi:hypothetical protein
MAYRHRSNPAEDLRGSDFDDHDYDRTLDGFGWPEVTLDDDDVGFLRGLFGEELLVGLDDVAEFDEIYDDPDMDIPGFGALGDDMLVGLGEHGDDVGGRRQRLRHRAPRNHRTG